MEMLQLDGSPSQPFDKTQSPRLESGPDIELQLRGQTGHQVKTFLKHDSTFK
ncbi:hypothetical protein PCASD_04136 [Puccinia coronata f. sp. avenae]|uniref:Uncharacterized protein n=1 Tax=Puccinia coronata f. sp. avenae TaxID=200324 RepID=A0A2N5V834_9BASI|nr:hypothetical protein PCASD_04136 [Puccinia coronata f. sp. avenae]